MQERKKGCSRKGSKLSAHISCSQRSPLIREGVLAHRLDSTSKNPRVLVSKASPCNRHPEFQPLRAWDGKVGVSTGDFGDHLQVLSLLRLYPQSVAMPAFAQMSVGPEPAPEIGARKIFFMLFLMLGPIKILVPFVEMTHGSDPAFRRRLATRAILSSAAAMALAGDSGAGRLRISIFRCRCSR